jgi:hypothetical protein
VRNYEQIAAELRNHVELGGVIDAETVEAIIDPLPDLEGSERVRRDDGALGWRKAGLIHPDADPRRSLIAYWMPNEWDGMPDYGYYAFDGWWFPLDT